MTKLKPSLKNAIKRALLFSLPVVLFVSGCESKIDPTYKEKDIPQIVKKICKDEYNLNVTTVRTPTTLWIYAPVEKILHKDFGLNEEKIFDEEIADKLRNILTTIGRVLISSDNTPEFFALVASDVNLGLDYTMIGNVLDMKKTYAGFTPWPEANRRYILRFAAEPDAIGDLTGSHLKATDINLPDFLALQIVQRINIFLQDVGRRKYYKAEKLDGKFKDGNFIFDYSITEISKPDKETNIQREIIKIISYCLNTYEFRGFSAVEIINGLNENKTVLNKASILAMPIN